MGGLVSIRRLRESLGQQGVWGTLLKLYIVFADRWFDFKHGTDTCSWVTLDRLSITSENRIRGVRYEPARVIPLRILLRRVLPLLPPGSALVDLGCGKGRILLIAAECGFRHARGVEFAPELCEIARMNCFRYKQSTGIATEFQVMESDVVDYPIANNENLFMLFNPFDEVVLQRVLVNIRASLGRHPRTIMICFYHTPYSDTVMEAAGFTRVVDLDYWGYRLTAFSNAV